MRTVLITGAGPTGVTGRAIKEYLENDYSILAPSSKELDLTDDNAVRDYFDSHQIDFVVHCATYRSNISQTTHMVDEELESNLRMYFALSAQSDKFQKMVYLGSGAEYDKSRQIVNINEEHFGEKIPQSKYGLGKYIMNQHCRCSENIYNLRMFGTLNKNERYTKNVVCNMCAKAITNQPISLRQDCLFSWIDINDVAKAIDYLFTHKVQRHDYNIALPQSYLLSEIASMLVSLCGNDIPIEFSNDGLNMEYTCNVDYFLEQFPIPLTDVRESLASIYLYWQNNKDNIEIINIDQRWK